VAAGGDYRPAASVKSGKFLSRKARDCVKLDEWMRCAPDFHLDSGLVTDLPRSENSMKNP
jgi:hypothetical protein